MADDKKANPDLVHCIYVLNGDPMSHLICDGVAYQAFSGDRLSYVNDVRYQDVTTRGPLPLGKYYIIDREPGGVLSRLRQPVSDFFARTDRSEWFSLYRDDGIIDDKTSINGIQRGAFRIHPVGPRGISEGCITLT